MIQIHYLNLIQDLNNQRVQVQEANLVKVVRINPKNLEMIQMEIQQHMTNMPSSNEYRELRRAAQHAVSNLSEILVLLEELPDADPNEQEELICETLRMLDEIRY